MKSITSIKIQPAFARIFVGFHDLDVVIISIFLNDIRLILGGVFLMVRGHSDILRGPHFAVFIILVFRFCH
ncbi:hypothetical protein AGR4C_Cc50389 [Agrobacterium tumefaciens str. Kerr 14]|uniref:Uncharacterized protein n=1 Tax=Agrobacterium tumefaciens str. Kerr 14 TaxID=1183424 RepID=A0A1S7Q355_AGRTU|nr:hypothetical protein AGR4C_Cc50389 [Agrobacterium tumefaciens str. Kerr 14]